MIAEDECKLTHVGVVSLTVDSLAVAVIKTAGEVSEDELE